MLSEVWLVRSCFFNGRYLVISENIRNAVLGSFLIILAGVQTNGQNSNACLIDQPLPELPKDYGTLDAQTSAMFRVEFLSDGTLGKIALVKSAHIIRLDELATEAVNRIHFEPKRLKGSPVTSYKTLTYRYSWRFPGWRVEQLKSLKTCPRRRN